MNRYQVDALGQVTSGKRYWSANSVVAGQQFEYTFDDIGNRKTAKKGGNQNGNNLRGKTYGYETDKLNRLNSRDVPGYVNVLGTAASTATVTVNSEPTYRHGEYFWKELSVDNSSAAVNPAVTTVGVKQDGSNADIVTTVAGNVFVPRTPEVFDYDYDGNLTSDGRWNYTWDAENRLKVMRSLIGSPAPERRIEYVYDDGGRRIRKTVWNDRDDEEGSELSDTVYVYDGWNLLAELDANASNAKVRTYVWGLDLSGSMQGLPGESGWSVLSPGAGGVGGLLQVTYYGAQTTNCFVAHDGNGNVAALVNAADGSIAARYEYGPFGELLRATGPMAKVNPFRFSTKYQDDETDLLYFGYRYYDASTGRWPNRDPIGEFGGMNLYGMAGNDPLNWFDVLGLCKKGDCQVKYLGSKNRRLAYFSIQNFMGSDLGTPPQEILDLIRDTTLEELFARLPREIFHTIASRITLILTADKNALLHWELRYKAKADYEIRKCECKKRNPWTLWTCCSEWGWSKPSKGTIDLKTSFSGEDFTPDVNNRSAFVQSLTSSFIESVRDGNSQYVTADGWGSVFQEEIEKKKEDLGCKNIEFVTDFK